MNLPRIRPIIVKKKTESFDNPNWIFEIKYDGFRAVLYYENEKCLLVSRQGKHLNFRNLSTRLSFILRSKGIKNCILDGEIVSMDDEGWPNFHNLILRRGTIMYIAFDILWLNGEDLRHKTLHARKLLLGAVVDANKQVMDYCFQASFSTDTEGLKLYQCCIDLNLEGVVAKPKSSTYSRSARWYKIRNPSYSQDAVRERIFHNKRRRNKAT